MGEAAGDIDLPVGIGATEGFERPDQSASPGKQLYPGTPPITLTAEDFVYPASERLTLHCAEVHRTCGIATTTKGYKRVDEGAVLLKDLHRIGPPLTGSYRYLFIIGVAVKVARSQVDRTLGVLAAKA